MNTKNCTSIYALILAAGRSTRFGATKQLARLGEVPLVRLAVDAATAACGDRLVLVVGHDWRAVSSAGPGTAGFLIRNEDCDKGMGTSLALGVRAVRHCADAVLVMLADQPRVDAGHVNSLINGWSGASDEIVATAYGDTAGPPTLFPAGCFDDLASLKGDTGGKQLFTDRRFRTRLITFEPAAIDIDTPDDLAGL